MSENAERAGSEGYEITEEGYVQMVDYLENVLRRQLEKLRKYDLEGAMNLAEEANDLAMGVKGAGVLGRPEFIEERERIQTLYKEIGLIIASERAEVAEKLQSIRKGMKILESYSNGS